MNHTSEDLEKWIKSLDRERLENIAFICVDRLIESEDLRYYPNDEELPNEPYWETCGEKIDE